MLLDLHIDRNGMGTFVTSNASKPICRLAWITEKPPGDWYVDTLDAQPRLGPYGDESAAIVAAFDYVQTKRMHITRADGTIVVRAPEAIPDRTPWPGFTPLAAQEAPGAVFRPADGPRLLREAAADLRPSQVTRTRALLFELADRWEQDLTVTGFEAMAIGMAGYTDLPADEDPEVEAAVRSLETGWSVVRVADLPVAEVRL